MTEKKSIFLSCKGKELRKHILRLMLLYCGLNDGEMKLTLAMALQGRQESPSS